MRKTTTNEFKDGLNLDLHPIVTPNTVLTDNLNGTFITYNGNEFCLQNDRGNTKVASLKNGFIAIGAKQYGGIIYIVSTNNNGLTEIGTYPGVDWANEEGTLNYDKYTTLGNLYIDSTYETKVEDGFRFSAPYSTKTPVTIEIQPSYDGSVNLVIVADKIKPIIINSGFSVLPENRYKLIEREQSVDTNKYSLDRLSEQLNLIRESFEITNIDLVGVNSGGQLKGGNYKFYIKFGDADYNQTDVVAESGIVSIFNGNDGVASTISGTILDERTDKMVGLFVTGLNHVYSKMYIYYSREYSDSNGYRMTEFGMLNDPIDMVSKDSEERRPVGSYIDPVTGATVTDTIGGQIIWITGFEQEVPIDKNELNVDYHTVDFARAEAQQANMLFLGNIGQNETFDLYRALKEFTKNITVVAKSHSLDSHLVDENLYDWNLYYDTNNIYNYLGYYPGEIYRFGIVYLLKDGSTTPVFNIRGGKFGSDGILIDNDDYNNENGVLLMPDFNGTNSEFSILKGDSVKSEVNPIYLQFSIVNDSFLKENGIKGWFVVRQKRIPNVVCQGLAAKVDKRSHTPVIYDGANWISQSFLSVKRYPLSNEQQDVAFLKYNNISSDSSGEILNYQDFTEQQGERSSTYYFLPLTSMVGITCNSYDELVALLGVADGSWWTSIYDENLLSTARTMLNSGSSVVLYQQEYYLMGANDGPIYVYATWWNRIRKKGGHPLRIKYSSLSEVPTNEISYPGYNQHNVTVPGGVYPVLEYAHNTNAEQNNVDAYNKYIATKSVSNKVIRETDDNYSNQDLEQLASRLSSDALISLDPCINPTVKSILNGSNFYIQKRYSVDISGTEDQCFYEYEPITQSLDAEQVQTKAVFIDSDTAIKVVDDLAFSTVAGDVADVSKYSYFSSPYLLNRVNEVSTGGYNVYREQFSSPEKNVVKSASNINLLRGKFCPFIGLTTNNFNSSGIYEIKLKKNLEKEDVLVRCNDNSEYYTISRRTSDNTIDVYGGDCYISTVTIRVIRNFTDPEVPISENIVDEKCWLENVTTKRFSFESNSSNEEDLVDFNKVNRADVNTVDLGMWVTFRCLSNYNLGLRSKDYSHVDEVSIMGSPRTFHPVNSASTATGAKIEESWLLNDGYNSTVGRKSYNLLPDVPYTKSEFSNRIMFSNVNVTDSYSNGYRTFQGLSYKDYDKQYGPITKLISWGNNLLCVMEHGIGLVAVNEKALLQTTTGEAIHIYGHGVLSDTMQMISQTYGSKYEHSVIRTPIGVYGIDTDARKVWRVTDKGFETISDMKIESYLNDNLFTDIDSNVQTVDVRTHYNTFKGDIMFTFYNTEKPYLIVPDYIEVYVDSEVLFDVQSNQNNLEFEIDDTEIAEIIMKNNKKYIKGLKEGITNVRVTNELVSKYAKVKVRKKANDTPVIEKTYLNKIPNQVVLNFTDPLIIKFTEEINPDLLIVKYNSEIVKVEYDSLQITLTGLSEGNNTIQFIYGNESKTCRVMVKDTETIPDTPTPQPDDEVVTEYYLVYIHKPRLNSKFGDSYPDDCTVYVTYDGDVIELEFGSGIEVLDLNVKKDSVITLSCNIPEYNSSDYSVKITSNKMNIYPTLGENKTVTINSCNPSNATIIVNDNEVSVGDVLTFPYGNLIRINANADGYLGYSEYKSLFNDWVVDINLAEGDFYLSFAITNPIYTETGAYQTSYGAPSGTRIDYTITNSEGSYSGTTDTSTGLSIPVHKGDSISYTISCDGFNTINGYEENIQGSTTNRYHMEPSGYYEFRAHNIPNGYHFVVVNGSVCWDTNVLNFKAGTEITIEVNQHGSYSFTMPENDVIVDITALVS